MLGDISFDTQQAADALTMRKPPVPARLISRKMNWELWEDVVTGVCTFSGGEA